MEFTIWHIYEYTKKKKRSIVEGFFFVVISGLRCCFIYQNRNCGDWGCGLSRLRTDTFCHLFRSTNVWLVLYFLKKILVLKLSTSENIYGVEYTWENNFGLLMMCTYNTKYEISYIQCKFSSFAFRFWNFT